MIPVLAAAILGAAWGLAGYAALWGHTPIVVQRPFVVSAGGTILLAPIRLVLWGIRLAEENLAGGPFEFSDNNAWIGALAGLVGALLAAGAFVLGRVMIRLVRRRATAAAGRSR